MKLRKAKNTIKSNPKFKKLEQELKEAQEKKEGALSMAQ